MKQNIHPLQQYRKRRKIRQNHCFRRQKSQDMPQNKRYAIWVSPTQKAHGTRITHEKSTNDISNIVNVIYGCMIALT